MEVDVQQFDKPVQCLGCGQKSIAERRRQKSDRSRRRPLNAQDELHYWAATRLFLSGDLVAASNELEEITAPALSDHGVLSLRHFIYAEAGRWHMAVWPKDWPGSWINLAHTKWKMSQTADAKNILIEAQVRFPREYLIPFNMACYCAQLNQLEESVDWLKKAMAIDEKSVQKLAVQDSDLKPLRDSLYFNSIGQL
jgi:tetratricopeptide (TPR) repeat protein